MSVCARDIEFWMTITNYQCNLPRDGLGFSLFHYGGVYIHISFHAVKCFIFMDHWFLAHSYCIYLYIYINLPGVCGVVHPKRLRWFFSGFNAQWCRVVKKLMYIQNILIPYTLKKRIKVSKVIIYLFIVCATFDMKTKNI